ncbi:MAG: TldD/PmbA family protein [Candidatus Thorarchaeota archaeon SMTZ1-45]
MTNVDGMKGLVDYAVDYGKDKTDAIIARTVMTSGSQIRFSQNAIDISKRWEQLQLQLFVVVKGMKTGSTERPVSTLDDVKLAVDDTVAFTEILPDSQFFAGIEDSVQPYPKLKGNYDPKFDSFVEDAPNVINTVVDSALEEGAKRVAGALRFDKMEFFFRSSRGPEGSGRRTFFDLNVRALQDELDYSGQGLSCGVTPSVSEKEMIEAGAKAGRLSKQAIGAVQGEPGTYDLVLTPTVAADVIGRIPTLANPISIMTGSSPLGDKMGEQIAPEFITASDDPLFEGGLSSRTFDWEGTPCRTTKIVDEGVLKSHVHNTTTAQLFETKSTGNSSLVGRAMKLLLPSPSNIVFENGDQKVEELLEVSEPTIYVTCNWYTRFQNQQTGDFSTIPRDAMFLVENCEFKPIKNMRISDNTMRMFYNIDALGDDRTQIFWWEVRTPTVIPTMRIRDCRMTAATQ